MLRMRSTLILCVLITACSQQPVIDDAIRSYEGPLPADLSGSWERDYSRGDEINQALDRSFRQLNRVTANQEFASNPRQKNGGPIASPRDVSSIVALARLAELITRLDYFTISQSEHELSIEREDDFAIFCEFYDGVAQGTVTDYGTEVCGWDGHQFVSHLVLPDGLLVTHRFTISADSEKMHVATTVSSSATRVPFTLNRFYMKFEPSAGKFNCIETLSMKRVCSTGELSP